MRAAMVAAFVAAYVETLGEASLPGVLELLASMGVEVHGTRTLASGANIVHRGLSTPLRDGLRSLLASGRVHARLGGSLVQLVAVEGN